MAAVADRVRRALSLRGAVFGLLADCESHDTEREAMQCASEDAWRILLACECCALPLAARLRQHALLATLPAATQRHIAAAELTELQRVLAARSTLDALDRACASLGVAAIVVKGGAIAAERRKPPLDLGDVDALVEERDAPALWTRLRELGWRRASGDPMRATPLRVDANHFEALVPPGEGLPLELHTRLDYEPRRAHDAPRETRPLEGHQVLRRLVGQDAFITSVRHSVVKHPHRRGHLRDLLMLADALGECAVDVARSEPAFPDDPMAPELSAMCGQARAMAERRRDVDDPGTRRFLTWKYATFVHPGGILGRVPGWSGLNYLPLERGPIRRSELVRQLRYGLGPVPSTSPFAALGQRPPNGTDRSTPVAGLRPLSRGVRVLYRLSLLGLLVLTSGYIRRRIDSMSRS